MEEYVCMYLNVRKYVSVWMYDTYLGGDMYKPEGGEVCRRFQPPAGGGGPTRRPPTAHP